MRGCSVRVTDCSVRRSVFGRTTVVRVLLGRTVPDSRLGTLRTFTLLPVQSCRSSVILVLGVVRARLERLLLRDVVFEAKALVLTLPVVNLSRRANDELPELILEGCSPPGVRLVRCQVGPIPQYDQW